jgi:rfaE bifunctional protein kinase chain/domain
LSITAKEIISKFRELTVLVIGDVMLDNYQFGQARRISPEAPVPVVEWGWEEFRLGGAANVALNLQRLGAKSCLCGVLGRDAEAVQIFDLLASNLIDSQGVICSSDRITTVKTRILAGSQQLLRLDREHINELTALEENAVLERISWLLSNNMYDAIIIQDYNKGVLTSGVIRSILDLAKQVNIPVAVDPKATNFWEYAGVKLFKPNLKEVETALSTKLEPVVEQLALASKTISERLNNEFTLITLSEHGVYLNQRGEQGDIYPSNRRNVADVSGAGDTVIAIASLGMALGLRASEIAMLANLAGGQVVEKVGVVPVDVERLQEELLIYSKNLANS